MALSIFLVMFAGIPANQPLSDVSGHFEHYGQAHREARQTGKPLLLVINSGPQSGQAATSLVSIRKTGERRKLLDNYVVVLIDASTKHGKAVHRAYEWPKLPHVVVLDKRQEYQIFATSEKLYGQRWTEILTTYRNGEQVKRRSAASCYS